MESQPGPPSPRAPVGRAAPRALVALTTALRQVTPDDRVKEAVDAGLDTVVTLVRGTSVASGNRAVQYLAAGGAAPDPACGRPTEAQAISQVGGSRPGVPQEKLPEFTAEAANAEAWARRGGFLVVQISARYLLRGDVGQSGWVCLPNAPLIAATFYPHPNAAAVNIPNAD